MIAIYNCTYNIIFNEIVRVIPYHFLQVLHREFVRILRHSFKVQSTRKLQLGICYYYTYNNLRRNFEFQYERDPLMPIPIHLPGGRNNFIQLLLLFL